MLPAAEISVRETDGEAWARVTDQQACEPPQLSAQVGDALQIPLGRSGVGIDCTCFAGRCGGSETRVGFNKSGELEGDSQKNGGVWCRDEGWV